MHKPLYGNGGIKVESVDTGGRSHFKVHEGDCIITIRN